MKSVLRSLTILTLVVSASASAIEVTGSDQSGPAQKPLLKTRQSGFELNGKRIIELGRATIVGSDMNPKDVSCMIATDESLTGEISVQSLVAKKKSYSKARGKTIQAIGQDGGVLGELNCWANIPGDISNKSSSLTMDDIKNYLGSFDLETRMEKMLIRSLEKVAIKKLIFEVSKILPEYYTSKTSKYSEKMNPEPRWMEVLKELKKNTAGNSKDSSHLLDQTQPTGEAAHSQVEVTTSSK